MIYVYIGSCPNTVFLREGRLKQRSLSHSGHFPQVPGVEKPKKTAKISRISPVFQVDCFFEITKPIPNIAGNSSAIEEIAYF